MDKTLRCVAKLFLAFTLKKPKEELAKIFITFCNRYAV